jgi:hypothetical protein
MDCFAIPISLTISATQFCLVIFKLYHYPRSISIVLRSSVDELRNHSLTGRYRQPGFDQALRRRRCHDPLAGPAGKFQAMRDDHRVLGRDLRPLLQQRIDEFLRRRIGCARSLPIVRSSVDKFGRVDRLGRFNWLVGLDLGYLL